jgi:hypothetical protein
MPDHNHFEELAARAALGELSGQELVDFRQHQGDCHECRQAAEEMYAVASAAFLAGAPKDNDSSELASQKRARSAIRKRIPLVISARSVRRYKVLIALAIAATFVFGVGLSRVVWLGHPAVAVASKNSLPAPPLETADRSAEIAYVRAEITRLKALIPNLQSQTGQLKEESSSLKSQLRQSSDHATELEARLAASEQQATGEGRELTEARGDLGAARIELSKTRQALSASETAMETLQRKLQEREAELTEVSASLDRERELLSNGREIRDIIGARDLHIVDVVDWDGKGKVKKAFGRAFYTQGRSLIFYAFDLPAKNTASGEFVYAAWGSNSNVNGKVPHGLGIFYNDDQSQHRWTMKFDDSKVLEEIDTVFVTLEPATGRLASPTGRPILEAYFGLPANHP